MTKFTVKAIMPTGKDSQSYGSEYYVQLNEMDDTAKLWYQKNVPAINDEIELEQVKGQWKKVKKEWNPAQNATQIPAADAGSKVAPTERTYHPYPTKNNSDGQRQGMCINNAANYFNTATSETGAPIMPANEWAENVYGYANALYALGDLTGETEDTLVATAAQDVFGLAPKKVPAK